MFSIVTDSGELQLPQLYLESGWRVKIINAHCVPVFMQKYIEGRHFLFLSEMGLSLNAARYARRDGYVIAREQILKVIGEDVDKELHRRILSRLNPFVHFPPWCCQTIAW